MNDLNIAVLQLNSSDDPADNQARIVAHLNQLKDPNLLDVIFLPENSLFIRVSKKMDHVGLLMDDPIYDPFKEFCRNHQCHILFGSNPVQTESGIENACVWVRPDGSLEKPYTKIHLFDVDVEGHKPVRESDDFVAGTAPSIIEINGWKIGLSICYDIRFSELYLNYARKDVDLITIPAAFLVPTGRAHWEVLQRARAIEAQAFVVSAAQTGSHPTKTEAERVSYGHSLAVDPWGEVIADLKQGEGFRQLILTKDVRVRVKNQIPMSQHRKL